MNYVDTSGEEMKTIFDSFNNAHGLNAIKMLENPDLLVDNVNIYQPERNFDTTTICRIIDTALNAAKGDVKVVENALKTAELYPFVNGDNPWLTVMHLAIKANRDDENIAKNILALTKQKNEANDYSGDKHISSASLGIYIALVRNNPGNVDIACDILNDLISREHDFDPNWGGAYSIQTNIIEYGFAYEMLDNMVKNNYKDEKFNQLALSYIGKNMQKLQGELALWDKENQERRENSLRTGSEYVPDFPHTDPRIFIISLAQNNVEKPEFVEQCLELSKKFPKYYQDWLYDNLLEAGYKANNFEGRYNLKQAKERVEKNLYCTKAMSNDIKSGMSKTEESGYKYVSEADRKKEQKSQLNIKNMKDAKNSLAK